MKKALIVVALALAPALAHAVAKCTDPKTGKVTYSDAACPSAQTNTKMEWMPRANTNLVVGTGGQFSATNLQIAPPDLTGDPASRLSKATAALENMAADGLTCKVELQVADKASLQALTKCQPFVQQMSSWWTPVMETLVGVARTPEAATLVAPMQKAQRIGERVVDYSNFVGLRMKSLNAR